MINNTKENINQGKLLVGIDVGSTTTKVVAVDGAKGTLLYSDYRRHHADQFQSIINVLEQMNQRFPGNFLQVALTGSGAKPIAKKLGLTFVQEVAANAEALKSQYNSIQTAIELGGQDAKMIFFGKDEVTGALTVSDMRMNGSCAGGTGAFIDEIASVLKVPVEEFNALAGKGQCVYDISGRCGVYAKTDIQPLLNQGIAKEDLALSAFHAIAKQTIGGLAQGLEIKPPVAFAGGPLTFNPVLVQVFAQRLGLSKEDVLVPPHSELIVAYGAALSMKNIPSARVCSTAGKLLEILNSQKTSSVSTAMSEAKPLFESEEEKLAFLERHKKPERDFGDMEKAQDVCGYLGIDSGSTTTKFVLVDKNENILDCFYAPNEGTPLDVARKALIQMRDKYKRAGKQLRILAAGTTGYGEVLFAKAFGADYHTVETVAHARSAEKYVKDATFILDIGGQDMKAIWLDHGIITNILVNEACSSGCGSFLENFASTLHIPVGKIAEAVFASKHPAVLGSRCTVFMNSSIITEQRNGRRGEDIMAGLCRSIIENVFTKVVRLSNVDALGDKIVVQGGTFENDAVLRALEEYIGKEVTRAPYPGLMGAIGVALIAKEQYEKAPAQSTFIALDELDSFSYHQEANKPCPFCTNHCKRTILTFSNGQSWITNNRCERGEILGDPKEEAVKKQLKQKREKARKIPNLFKDRQKLLFQDYDCPRLLPDQKVTIGMPRILSFWETAPFWTTFWKSLGFGVVFSDFSTRKIYEDGLSAVTSDTVCFPAKLVHGHLRNLKAKGVDRIFMPIITTVPSENTEETSQSMCAIVKGYPLVIKNSDNPEEHWGIPYDAPMFHWYTQEDKQLQLIKYMSETFHISRRDTIKAMEAGDRAQESFSRQLKERGAAVIDQVKKEHAFAVVLASRPYQNDALVNHELPEMFAGYGIPVLTADSLPEVNRVDLSKSRLDIVNNYHARMLSGAITAAEEDALEYVQIVSFGCGHDAYLSDEIIRLMNEISKKTPLVLKVDESDVQGPLRIRVRSFLETVAMKRSRGLTGKPEPLKDPYPVKYTKDDRKLRTVLVPNTSHAFSRIMAAVFASQGIKAVPLELGREEAIRLGKKYVHNDICFPAQIVIGEALAALKSGKYDPDTTAIGMAKYIGDCRLTHYSSLLRKALDDAGFEKVPILTNDDTDAHNLHPGFCLNVTSALRIVYAMPMIDALEELLRKIRPYELTRGSADQAFERAMDALVDGLEHGGVAGAKEGFKKAIEMMKEVAYDRSHVRPQVLIVGEYLLNFHPGANHDIERYLEDNGFEVIEAKMTDVIRKTYFYQDSQIKEYHVHRGLAKRVLFFAEDHIFNLAHDTTDKIAKSHPLYHPACRMQELVGESDPIIHHTFDAGEGVLIPAEILHHAKEGCRTFVILQPFGCLPNHVVGRGISKKLKAVYPDAQILPLDYDPDVSFANIENRLQMLVMNMRAAQSMEAAKTENTKPRNHLSGLLKKEGKERLSQAPVTGS
ncbi:putative CoA-substrate-specific enzyme activase [Catenibacillus scindens]|uniref:Putative CoA-substrate-specific enzyme activase n=1 Tax=Catenibacillus scindens TaxID=673271 RepID=A0A7W8H8M8_9FIRM|nr:acyl-CoA dehydratase activase [Catenibacillus scindens]MBB5263538.1 putative CoA-substrate-specific enzyme activase [Catenibacillus scindens]